MVKKAALDGETPPDLLPTTGRYPDETVRYESVVLTKPASVAATPLSGRLELLDDDETWFDAPAEGVVVTTEQTWTAVGVSLGRLMHSVALAPGESTKIALIEFSAQTTGVGRDELRQDEELSQAGVVDRTITEVTNSVAQEEQTGEANSWSVQAAVAAYLKGRSLGGSVEGGATTSVRGGYAKSASRSGGSRNLGAEVSQRIAAKTDQVATSARSRQSVAIHETRQSETEHLSTRVVTNYNHMHALTIQYYAVVQAYRVRTRPVRYERCIFVPMARVEFTDRTLYEFAQLLAAAAPEAWAGRIRALDPFAETARKPAKPTPAAAPGPVSAKPDPLASVPKKRRVFASEPVFPPDFSLASPVVRKDLAGVDTLYRALWRAADGTSQIVTRRLVGDQPQPWTKAATPAPFTQLAAGLFALDQDGHLYGLNLTSDDSADWTALPKTSAFSAFAFGSDATMLGITGSQLGQVELDDPRDPHALRFRTLGCRDAIGVAFSDKTNVWALRANGSLQRFDLTARSMEFHNAPVPLSRISVTADGTVWGIAADHDNAVLYRDTGDGTWYHVPDLRLTEIAGLTPDEIFGVDILGAGRRYDLTTAVPAAEPPPPAVPVVMPEPEPDPEPAPVQPATADPEAELAAVLAHLNENATYYSPIVWSFADENTLGRNLARYTYQPPGAAEPEPLGLRVDPRPIATSGNYLAFRWAFSDGRSRRAWLRDNGLREDDADATVSRVVGLPTGGVFGEAVLGRANSAEKIDVTRFWDWQKSVPPYGAPTIEKIEAGRRPITVESSPSHDFAALAAKIDTLAALPAPATTKDTLAQLAALGAFRDQSGAAGLPKALGGEDLAGTLRSSDRPAAATQPAVRPTTSGDSANDSGTPAAGKAEAGGGKPAQQGSNVPETLKELTETADKQDLTKLGGLVNLADEFTDKKAAETPAEEPAEKPAEKASEEPASEWTLVADDEEGEEAPVESDVLEPAAADPTEG